MTTNYTCPECGATVTQEQLSIKGMCPECGCPAPAIYAAQQEKESQERRENLAKEAAAAAALPKTSDERYKTGASKMLEVFAWIIWVCGIIDVIAIAIYAGEIRSSYYLQDFGNSLFLVAVVVASSALFFGGLLYGASKLLIDIHATRVNLEQLNEKKEAQQ